MAAEQAPVVDDRREAIASALATATEGAAEPAPTQVEPTQAAAEPVKAETPTKDRAPDGKFAKGNAVAKKVETAPVVETPAERKAREYPGTWKKDYEPVYRKLEANPEFSSVLDEIERREGDMKRGIEQYKNHADYGQRFQKTLQPYEQTFQQLGLQPDVAIQRLLQADHALRNAPPHLKAQMAHQLLQGYGIDPSGIGEAPQVDPNQQFMLTKLQQLEQQNQTLLSSFQKQLETEASVSVAEFAKDKPLMKNDEVRAEMKRLLDKGVCETLPDAYERAIYSLPATREKMFAERQAQAESERRQKAQTETERAKTASVQVRGAPTGNAQSAPSKAKDRRAFIAEQLNS